MRRNAQIPTESDRNNRELGYSGEWRGGGKKRKATTVMLVLLHFSEPQVVSVKPNQKTLDPFPCFQRSTYCRASLGVKQCLSGTGTEVSLLG